jgi:hypothetical protein
VLFGATAVPRDVDIEYIYMVYCRGCCFKN